MAWLYFRISLPQQGTPWRSNTFHQPRLATAAVCSYPAVTFSICCNKLHQACVSEALLEKTQLLFSFICFYLQTAQFRRAH